VLRIVLFNFSKRGDEKTADSTTTGELKAIMVKYEIADNSVLTLVAKIIHAADVSADVAGSPEETGFKP
jgi:hypothetical protein